jgi:hypothetical protein
MPPRIPPEQVLIRRITDRTEAPIRAIVQRAALAARRGANLTLLERLLANALQGGGIVDLATVSAILEVDTMLGRIAVDLRPLLEKALLRASLVGAEVFAGAMGIAPVTDVAVYRVRAERAARKLVGDLVTGIGQGQRLAIREVIATGYREGLPVKKLAETLRGVVGLDERRAGALAKFQVKLEVRADLTVAQRVRLAAREEARLLKSRTLAIAKTESVRAGSRAQEVVWQAAIEEGELAGEQWEQEWLSGPDACPEICAPLAGARAGIGEEFPGEGGDGPPAHPWCDCGRRLVRRE